MDTKVIHDAVARLLKNQDLSVWLPEEDVNAITIVTNAAIEYANMCDKAQNTLDALNRKAEQWTDVKD